ncbi:unnamed protein product [Colias eurytheme]|nr:unnamed protein product [Colias eurytheme]
MHSSILRRRACVKSTHCQWKGPVMPSFSLSLRDRWREGPGPGGSVPAPAGTAAGGARAGDDIATRESRGLH